MVYKQLLIHQNNRLSFSYQRNHISKQSYINYKSSLTKPDYNYVQSDDSQHLSIIQNGIYNKNNNHTFTICNLSDIHRSYYLSDNLYFYIIKNLFLNTLDDLEFNHKINFIKVKSISSSFYPEDILEINLHPYYKIKLQEKHYALNLSYNSKVYNESGHKKTINELLSSVGQIRLMGLNNNHQLNEFKVESIQVIEPIEASNFYDTPFYSLVIPQPNNINYNIIMDPLIVELD